MKEMNFDVELTASHGTIAQEPTNRHITELRRTLIHRGCKLIASCPNGAEFAETLVETAYKLHIYNLCLVSELKDGR